jgi:hypothetical protein
MIVFKTVMKAIDVVIRNEIVTSPTRPFMFGNPAKPAMDPKYDSLVSFGECQSLGLRPQRYAI